MLKLPKQSQGIPPANQPYVNQDLTGSPWLVQFLNDVSRELFSATGTISQMQQKIEALETTVQDLQNQIDSKCP